MNAYNVLDMKTLHLTKKKKWFDMSHPLTGSKHEEYRELKLYWVVRLAPFIDANEPFLVEAKNGYKKDVPVFQRICTHITVGKPNPLWTDTPNITCFILHYKR